MQSMSLFQEAAENTISWVWYLLVVVVVLAAIMWWIYQQSRKQSQEQPKEKKKEEKKPESSRTPDLSRERKAEDDLTRIEGIGPKVAKILRDAGIKNFDSLSTADPAEVKNVLNKAGLQMMNPEGWIEQAELAAKGDWEGLQKLQDELKGGRRR